MTGLAVLVVAGCGSSSRGSGGAASPTIHALSYFPTTSPFVITAATNPKAGAVKQLQRQNPSYALAATAVFAQLSKLGIDYNKDIRPLFGNPVTAGLVSADGLSGSGSGAQFLVVWVTKSASKLTSLLGKLHLSRNGTHDGATLYSVGDAGLATSGATVILARSTAVLDAALDRHAHHQGFDAASLREGDRGGPDRRAHHRLWRPHPRAVRPQRGQGATGSVGGGDHRLCRVGDRPTRTRPRCASTSPPPASRCRSASCRSPAAPRPPGTVGHAADRPRDPGSRSRSSASSSTRSGGPSPPKYAKYLPSGSGVQEALRRRRHPGDRS